MFAAATRMTLGDGKTASFWQSSWTGSSTLAARFPSLFAASRRKQRSVADALHDHRWVRDLRHAINLPILDEFIDLWREINNRNLQLQEGTADTISWLLTADRTYSARSAYRLQFEGQIKNPLAPLVWKTWAPANGKFFAWLMLQDKLWCNDRLQRRQWTNGYFCSLCNRNLETSMHLFLECPVSRRIWEDIASWLHSDGLKPQLWRDAVSITAAWQASINATPPPHRPGTKSMLILISWSIWKERCSRVFNNKSRSIPQITQFIKDEARAWAFAGANKLKKLLDWEPPLDRLFPPRVFSARFFLSLISFSVVP